MMDLGPVDANPSLVTDPAPTTEEVNSREIGDSYYTLIAQHCPRCGRRHYRLLRAEGVFFSAYRLPEEFSPDDFDTFVEHIHHQMLFDARAVLDEAKELVSCHNDKTGIANDGSFFAQMLDFTRLRLAALSETGALDSLEASEPASDDQRALRWAFELGYAASDLRIRGAYEDAIIEGFRIQEGRVLGREAAAKSNATRTRRTRQAIERALASVYASQPGLRRNDTAAAKEVEAMALPELRRKDGRSIGFEAILKHLRAIRQTNIKEIA